MTEGVWADWALLDELHRQVMAEQHGADLVALLDELHALAVARRAGEPTADQRLAARVEALDQPTATVLTRALDIYFELRNLCEDRQRLRVLRERARRGESSGVETPAEVLARLRATGRSTADILDLLAELRVEPVFTAHPTEAKRRTGRAKLKTIRELLSELDQPDLLPAERTRLRRRILAELTCFWQTDMLREARPAVLDEVRRGLYFTGGLWEVVPRLAGDLAAALDPEAELPPALPRFLQFGSWIGGDRDGHPQVTAQVTAQTLLLHRRTAVERHLALCRRLFVELSLSERQVPADPALRQRLEDVELRWPGAIRIDEDRLATTRELHRRWLQVIEWRLEQTLRGEAPDDRPVGSYRRATELQADVQLLADSLATPRCRRLLAGGLADWLEQIKVFGLHLARLDIRQESRAHELALDELFRAAGIHPAYRSLSEPERQELLAQRLDFRGPILLGDLSEATRETVALFRLLRRVVEHWGPEPLGGYVVSLTHHPSDLFEVLWLAAWSGLLDTPGAFRLIPLFETIDDLRRAAGILEQLLQQPVYRAHLAAAGDEQLLMIGYSDSTKDGGYLAANWALHRAQRELSELAGQHGVRAIFFHGRGGALGRGGGPTARAVESLPPRTVAGGLRLTEQGEVLADRYDDPALTARHLELLVATTLRVSYLPAEPEDERWPVIAEDLAERALVAYRELVEAPGFVDYFEQATPLEPILGLPIASRPARRRGELKLSDLRAIPWVFAWTQSRHLVPAWYGLGAACAGRVAAGGEWAELRELYARWSFFRATCDNAALALAKVDIGLIRRYAGLVEEPATRALAERIIAEEARTRTALETISGRAELLADVPWLAAAVRERSPWLDLLNFLQLAALRRTRTLAGQLDDTAADELQHLLRLTIQGIAAGLRSTG